MSQRKQISRILAERRGEMIKYAGAISGDGAEAEDLVQEAWIRCDSAAQARTVEKPAHMFWRVLRNLSIDRRRKITRQGRFFEGGTDDSRIANHPDEHPTVEDMLVARDELARIQKVLDNLDARTRIAFEMHRFEGAKLREIAAHLGISTSSAHALVASALRQIRDAVGTDF